jgi:hypothetical protein
LLIEAKYRYGILNDLRSGLVILLTSVFVLISGVTSPSYNWDIVAYVAAAYHQDGLSGKQLSSATYSELEREADADTFKELTVGDYVDVVFKDPDSLEQQLPFYTIKVAYIQLMRVLKTFGVSYTSSTYIISAMFTSASVLMIALFLFHFRVPILWLPVAAAVAGYGTIASYSTPDAIACFFALLLIYFFIKGSKASYVISALLPLVRTDLVILSILTMGFDFYRRRSIYPILSAAAASAMYVIINRLAGNYGWLALFNFTFIKITPYPKEMQISDDIGAYLQAYVAGVRNFISSRHIMIYVLVLFIFVFRQGHKRQTPEINAIMVICLLYASAHFALFPVYEDRFFAFPASLLFLSLIVLLFYSDSVSPARQAT